MSLGHPNPSSPFPPSQEPSDVEAQVISWWRAGTQLTARNSQPSTARSSSLLELLDSELSSEEGRISPRLASIEQKGMGNLQGCKEGCASYLRLNACSTPRARKLVLSASAEPESGLELVPLGPRYMVAGLKSMPGSLHLQRERGRKGSGCGGARGSTSQCNTAPRCLDAAFHPNFVSSSHSSPPSTPNLLSLRAALVRVDDPQRVEVAVAVAAGPEPVVMAEERGGVGTRIITARKESGVEQSQHALQSVGVSEHQGCPKLPIYVGSGKLGLCGTRHRAI
jgi:hypothetical protein